jgi:hypothetical protein
MPRLLSILLLLAAMPAWAQFRGMSRPGVGMAAPRFAGRSFAGPARMGAPMVPARFGVARGGGVTIITRPGPRFFPRTTSPFFHPFFPRFGRFGSFCAFHPFSCLNGFGFPFFGGFGGVGFGGVGFGGWGWGGGAPYYPLSDASYYGDYGASAQLQATLAQQQQLTADLEDQLRKERVRRLEAEHDAEAPPPPPQRSTQPSQERPTPPTILVFRDGSRTEIQNYVIADNVIYQFAEHWMKKIPLSDVDIPATVKVNDARGVEFSVPTKQASVK